MSVSEKISEDNGKVVLENNKRDENAKETMKANKCTCVNLSNFAPITHFHKKVKKASK